MAIAVWSLSLLLIAKFVMAPVNLWTGRTMPLFTWFTGYPPQVAARVFAPVKLASAVLMGIGLAVPCCQHRRRCDHHRNVRRLPDPARRAGLA